MIKIKNQLNCTVVKFFLSLCNTLSNFYALLRWLYYF